MRKLGLIKENSKTIFPLLTTRPRTMTFAEYQLLTPEQRQGEIIISDYPVPVEGDYVEVTADGVKTYGTLFNELFALIDMSKININSKILQSSSSNSVFHIDYIATSSIKFVWNSIYSQKGIIQEYILSNNSSLLQWYNNTYTDVTSSIPNSGIKFTLYYNSTKTLELGTLAQNCMMSDGVTSVEDKLGELIKVVDVPYSDFTWTNATKSFASGNAYPPPNGYTTLGFLVYFKNGDAIASARYGSSSYNVRVMGWIPSSSESVDSTYKFVCRILFKKS